jgi:hypothetical protein
MWREHLVEPAGERPLLEAEVARLGDGFDGRDEGSGVGLDDLRRESPAAWADDGDRAA